MNKTNKILNIIFVLSIFFMPFFVHAQAVNGDINAESVASAYKSLVRCKTVDKCTWVELQETLNRVKNYGFQLVVVMSVFFIVYAGGLYLTSMGNSGKIEQAKNIISNVVIGFFLASAGWLIVSAILKTLEVNSDFAPADLLQK